MEKCPYCGSDNIYYSKKRRLFVCEDCDETFDTYQAANSLESKPVGGLDLFFSYGHDKNRELVERIKTDLEKRGHRVWIDTNEIKAGDSWRNDILNGVLKSSNVIAFLSEHSTRNPGVCLDELKIAVCVKGASIKTVLLEPENSINQPATLSDIQWLDMSRWADIKQASEEQFEIWYQEKLAELCQVIESDESFRLSGDIQNLKSLLSPYLNNTKEYHLLSKEFYGRKWLSDYIEDWKEKDKNKSLIIYGAPGTGKSAFCVNFAHYNANVYGCFLCEWNREYSINANQLIRTMAFRLATKLPDYRSLLLEQLNQQVGDLSCMSDDALFEFLLSYPLNHLVDGGRNSGVVIIDGLDEAEVEGDNPLASVFSKCVDQLPRWIKFVFTSRPEKNVTSLFNATKSVNLVTDIPDGFNDIMAYLLRALSIELQQVPNRIDILNRICKLSEGVFLYAELFVEDVKNGQIDLNNTTGFPRGLSDFYRQSMQRKFKSRKQFEEIKTFIELLSVSDTVPEQIVIDACQYTKYTYLRILDNMGSWVNRNNEMQNALGFSHKSLADWFTDESQSGYYYVDKNHGALVLARCCRELVDESTCNRNGHELIKYAQNHVGQFYVLSEAYDELEQYLIIKRNDLNPYWRVWNRFPDGWEHDLLLDAFWTSPFRNDFAILLQREGNTSLLKWILSKAKNKYGISHFDNCLVSVYTDAIHISGDYRGAVEIADQLLQSKTKEEVNDDEFCSMLKIRKIHHSMFYKPIRNLIDDSLSIYAETDERFPRVMNELLFLLGGNLGVLYGDWDFAEKWLNKSEEYAQRFGFVDFSKRNSRKIADLFCYKGKWEMAEETIFKYIDLSRPIEGRYENYLICSLGNVYTCMGKHNEALECFERALQYSSANGIIGWAAHAYLGIANVHYKLGNDKEATEFSIRANRLYKQIKQEWGIIMSETLLAACESKIGIAPLNIACQSSILRAKKMQYGSCVEAINNLCNHKTDYLMLLYL